MAENLNYSSPEGSWWYDDKPGKRKKYDRLYTWKPPGKLGLLAGYRQLTWIGEE